MRHLLLLPLLFFITLLVIVPISTFNQQQPNPPRGQYQVVKTKDSEHFVFPYSASNSDSKHPFIYTYDKPKVTDWILTIQNNMSYIDRQGAKTIVKLREPAPNEKFIEIVTFGDVSKKFWAAVNTKESGYVRIYERDTNGWFTDQPISMGYASNQGLTITNGKRIIIDRLSIGGFSLDSTEVYGANEPESLLNTYAGNISFDLIFGNPADSPIYYLPLGMLIGVGGILTGLLVFKKRKVSPSSSSSGS